MLSEKDNSIAMKLQRAKKWIAFYLVFALLLGFVPMNNQVYANTNEGNVKEEVIATEITKELAEGVTVQTSTPSSISVDNLKVRQVENITPDKKEIDLSLKFVSEEQGDNLKYDENGVCQLKPEPKTTRNIVGGDVSCRLQLRISDNEVYNMGEVEIHLPKYLFQTRDGIPSGTYTIGIPQDGSREGFAYKETEDAIIIYNTKEIKSAIIFFCDITYQCIDYMEYQMKDGDVNFSSIADKSRANIQGTVRLGGTVQKEEKSNILVVQYNTECLLNSVNNTGLSYSHWQESWGQEPENLGNVMFIQWELDNWIYNTQPFSLKNQVTFHDNGTVLAYKEQGQDWNLVENGSNTIEFTQNRIVDSVKNQDSVNSFVNKCNVNYRVIVMYPRPVEDVKEYTSELAVYLTGVDNQSTQIVSQEGRAKYERDPDKTLVSKAINICWGIGVEQDSAFIYELIKRVEPDDWIEPISFNTKSMNRLGELTRDQLGEYGVYSHTTEITHDLFTLNSERLEETEYRINRFKINAVEEPSGIVMEPKGIPVVQYQKGKNGEWIIYNGALNYDKWIALPDGVTGVKLLYTSKTDEEDLYLHTDVQIKATDKIKKQIENYKNPEDCSVSAISTMRILDHLGECAKIEEGIIDKEFLRIGYDEIDNQVNNIYTKEEYDQLKAYARERDEKLYGGQYAFHRAYPKKNTKITKTAHLSTLCNENVKNGSAICNYKIKREIKGVVAEKSYEKIFGKPYQNAQEIYYILLPRGAELTPETLEKIQYNCSYNIRGFKKYNLIYNWRNSARTMLVLEKQLQDLSSEISIDIEYSNLAYIDFGRQLHLNVAYENSEYDFDNLGYEDVYTNPFYNEDGVAILEKEQVIAEDTLLMSSLSSSQIKKANILYAKNIKDLGYWNMAGNVGTSMLMKSEKNKSYTEELQMLYDETYKYCVRLKASDSNYSMKELIIYDMLETAQKDAVDRGNWKGEFVDVDTSVAEWLGIKPVVYYTTKSDVVIDENNIPNLHNTDIWTTQRPQDPSMVKGIAVDLSKKEDGITDYILEGEQGVPIYITMRSPKNNLDETLTGCVYNSAWFSGKKALKSIQGKKRFMTMNTNDESFMTETGYVQYRLVEPNVDNLWVEITDVERRVEPEDLYENKEKYPDWSWNPIRRQYVHKDYDWANDIGYVDGGSPLTYRITVGNSDALAIRNVKVEDIIPEGVSFDINNIKIRNDMNVELSVYVSTDPQNDRKLIFDISLIPAGVQVEIDIPTTANYLKEAKEIENMPRIIEVDGNAFEKDSGFGIRNIIRSTTQEDIPTHTFYVRKDWSDNSDKEKKRPSKVEVQLLENGKYTGKILTLSEENGWLGIFENMPVYDEIGKIEYTVQEMQVPEKYVAKVEVNEDTEFVITNIYQKDPEPIKRTILVTKDWQDENNKDGKRPTEVTIKLFANKQDTGKTLILSEVNHWAGAFENIAQYDENRQEIVYEVQEVNIPIGYIPTIVGNMDTGFTITNTYKKQVPPVIEEKPSTSIPMIPLVPAKPIIPVTPIIPSIPEDNTKETEDPEIVPTRTITVVKEWNDEGNKGKKRPEKVKIQLLKNGKQTDKELILSEENSWKGSFFEVLKYENGQEIAYSVKEVEVPDYKAKVTGTMEEGFVVINTYSSQTKQEIRDVLVRKEWNDNNNQRKQRPKNVTIQLLANGKKVGKTLMLSEGNHWSGSFKGLLQKDSFGKMIVYTIEEVPVLHYVSNITGNMQDGFVVTNTNRDTDTGTVPKEEQKPSEPTTSEPTTTKKDKPKLELELNKKKNKPIDVDSPRMRREVLKNIELFLQGQRGDKLGELELELLKKQGIEVPTSGRMTREVLRQIEMFIQGIRGGELEPMNVQSQQGLQDNSKLVVKTYDAMKLGMYSVGFVSAGAFLLSSIWKRKKKK